VRLLARLESMPVIEQAKGIIMAQSHCGHAEAFDLLRRASQRANVPVRELAAQIVAKAAQASPKPAAVFAVLGQICLVHECPLQTVSDHAVGHTQRAAPPTGERVERVVGCLIEQVGYLDLGR
jgi:hypothetical protein